MHRLRSIHGDQDGSMSLVAVFTVVALVTLLGLVMNSTSQLEQKVRMQNAADAATYSGGVVFTRNLNTVAFTNHLLSDVFSLTAFMREGRDRRAESLTPEILDNWERIGKYMFLGSPFTKFDQLGMAIGEKIPPNRAVDGDREMIKAYGDWAAAGSELMLPVFETTLQQALISQFQRSLVEATPAMMQLAADDVARRHAESWPGDDRLYGVMWRTDGHPVVSNDAVRVLPVVDPVLDPVSAAHRGEARNMRFDFAHRYMRRWNNEAMDVFDEIGEMSQFSSLWRILTGGELQRLLDEEYHNNNLPLVLENAAAATSRHSLELDFMFVGVVYREKRDDLIPGVFQNPTEGHSMAYAQVFSFVPRRRLVYRSQGSATAPPGAPPTMGGIPGQNLEIPGDTRPPLPPQPLPPEEFRHVVRQSSAWYNERWSTGNQNWTVQLTPATCARLNRILSAVPDSLEGEVEVPDLGEMSHNDMLWMSLH